MRSSKVIALNDLRDKSQARNGATPAVAANLSDVKLQQFDHKLVEPFIYKSISEETRRTYRRAISDFFTFVNHMSPLKVTPRHVISYRDHLMSKAKSVNTVNLKLSVIRSLFDYLIADGLLNKNPASTKFVSSPPASTDPSGRALTSKEMRYLLSGPDRNTTRGARDYALMLVMARLSLRVNEACAMRLSNIKWNHGRWVLKLKVKRGREETWPLPEDVKEAIDEYLKLDGARREMQGTAGPESYIFQPHTNYRTLEFNKPLSSQTLGRVCGYREHLAT